MITTATAKGRRSHQEDRFFVSETPDGILIGVFDGHGGDNVSALLYETFPTFWSAIDGDAYEHAMLEVFKMAHKRTEKYHAGSTASLVFISRDGKTACIAVLGDSPVMAERADGSLFVGPDHNARLNMEERSMAIARGGFYQGGYIWSGYGDNAKGLQMTRALGDVECQNFLNRDPEVFTIPLGDWLLVGSDGLFDPAHLSEDAYDDVFACIRTGNSAEDIVRQALALPTNDNVTAVLWRRK